MVFLYKSQNKENLNKFKAYLQTKEDGEATYKFFKKKWFVDDLNTYLRLKTKDKVTAGFGNYNASIVIVLPEEDIRHINFFKKTINDFANKSVKVQNVLKKKIDFNSLYFTYHRKCNNENLNREVLTKELNAINPKAVLFISDDELDGDIFFSIESITFSESIFNKTISFPDTKDMISEEKLKIEKEKRDLFMIIWEPIFKLLTYY